MIGIGVGDPGHITQSAAQALAAADVVFIPDKGDEKGDLKAARLDLRLRPVKLCELFEVSATRSGGESVGRSISTRPRAARRSRSGRASSGKVKVDWLATQRAASRL